MKKSIPILIASFLFLGEILGQNSVAKEWNEVNLNAVRNDKAQPTLTARNLWHVSAAMYDAWAAFDNEADTYYLGKNVSGYYTPFNGITIPTDPLELMEEREAAISYAAYRLLSHRYGPGFVPEANEAVIQALFDDLMIDLGYDMAFTSTDYSDGNGAALGNYIAQQIIAFGIQDGSNELGYHENQYYEPENIGLLIADLPGNPSLQDPNRWQRLLQTLDQNAEEIDPEFLSPEWGNVVPFSLTEEDATLFERDENYYKVYCDPGQPPHLDEETDELGLDDDYKKGFMMVSVWSSLLDPTSGVMIDVSPNGIGNIQEYPEDLSEYDDFYDFFTGLDASQGYDVNPATGMPYDTQMVPMGDYGRVLAEFWADGPDSETPPGHWFTILNYVNDHPDLEKRWNGEGDIIDDLEWDVKTYFALGGTMHDCAISAWSVKGWYDYIRPIGAIRYMADQGQCSDMTLPNYSPSGLPLIEGFSELVDLEDPLIGVSQENLDKIKIKAWKGPDYLDQLDDFDNLIEPIQDSTFAGVGWILAENWWPYQRPSFITPPFAGYVSGHSTFSRGAAELLALMTGDEYFPGGMGVFPCPQNDFLVFEEGPSVDLELQWAKYTDASDQCSLSRIFGGIHPPVDDIPGRVIGEKIGIDVFSLVEEIIFNDEPRILSNALNSEMINDAYAGSDLTIEVTYNMVMNMSIDPMLTFSSDASNSLTQTGAEWLDETTFMWTFSTADADETITGLGFEVSGAENADALVQQVYSVEERFDIDTENPTLADVSNVQLINEASAGTLVELSFEFSEPMSIGIPSILFSGEDPTVNSLSSTGSTIWTSEDTFTETYLVSDADEELYDILVEVGGLEDAAGNPMVSMATETSMVIDTKSPEVLTVSAPPFINESNVGEGMYSITITYDDDMNSDVSPLPTFLDLIPEMVVEFNPALSSWVSADSYEFVFDVTDTDLEQEDIDVEFEGGTDDVGNPVASFINPDLFSIDTKAPEVLVINDFEVFINDESTGSTVTYALTFDEPMSNEVPTITFDPLLSSLVIVSEVWLSNQILEITFEVIDGDEDLTNINVIATDAMDMAGNSMIESSAISDLVIDNKNPCAIVTANTYDITLENAADGFELVAVFDEEVDQNLVPNVVFPAEDPSSNITLNSENSDWFGPNSYIFNFDVEGDLNPLAFIDVEFQNIQDLNGNDLCVSLFPNFFSIQLDTFLIVNENEIKELKVFPNPVVSGDQLTVQLNSNEAADMMLIDALGRKVDISFTQTGSSL